MPNWDVGFLPPFVDGTCHAVASADGDLFVGGELRRVGGLGLGFVVWWERATNRWSTLASGVDGPVYALAVSGNDVFVGGAFARAGDVASPGIARFDRATRAWSTLGGVTSDTGWPAVVKAIAVDDRHVTIGGHFTRAGGVAAANVARRARAGGDWNALGAGVGGGSYSAVDALALVGDDVFVGGRFTRAGAVDAANLARWRAGAWSAPSGGTNGPINTLLVLGSDLLMGGAFTRAGGASVAYLARWSHAFETWGTLDFGLDGEVLTMHRAPSILYIGGRFEKARGVEVDGLIGWELSSGDWVTVGGGVHASDLARATVRALASLGYDVVVGGSFDRAGTCASGCVALWNGNAWRAVAGQGSDAVVRALAAEGARVAAGGAFEALAGVSARALASWDGTSWQSVDAPFAEVSALAWAGADLLAGGHGLDGGVSRSKVARRSAGRWTELGTLGGDRAPGVLALTQLGDDVYAGGGFGTAGGVRAGFVARWNGAWQELAGGTDGIVRALAVIGSDVYVGGDFTRAGGIAARGIARWTPSTSSWAALADGVDGSVLALAVIGSELFVGGSFGTPGANVARWDPATGAWAPLRGGTNGGVRALVAHGDALFVGGELTSVDGQAALRFASWSTTTGTWTPIGGADAEVLTLASTPTGVVAGGRFATLGTQVAAHLGRWSATPAAVVPVATPRGFVHVATAANIAGNYTWLDHPLANGHPDAVIVATPNGTPNGAAGVASNHHYGVWYGSGRWAIYYQDMAPMPLGAAFNVVVSPASESATAFVHRVTASNVAGNWSTLERADITIDNLPLVTANWNPGEVGGTYNDHALGWWHPSRWAVYNEDRVNLPLGAAFNVLLDGAHVHVATAANTSGDTTTLDDAAANGNPRARVLVAHHYSPPGQPSMYLAKAIAVVYRADVGRWGIRLEDRSAMPLDVGFIVKVYR